MELVHEIADEPKDLGLGGDVESRCRLVGDQQVRIAGEAHRDQDPLPHPTAELVRIAFDALLRIREADPMQQGDRRVPRLLPQVAPRSVEWRDAYSALVSQAAEADIDHLLLDREDRVEVGVRVLEDHANVSGAELPQLGRRLADDTLAQEADVAADDLARRRGHQLGNAQRRDRLAAAGLADQTHNVAALQAQVDSDQDLRNAVERAEVDAEILDLDDGTRRGIRYATLDRRHPGARRPAC